MKKFLICALLLSMYGTAYASEYRPQPFNGTCGFARKGGVLVRIPSFSYKGTAGCPSDDDMAGIGMPYVKYEEDFAGYKPDCGVVYSTKGTKQYSMLSSYYKSGGGVMKFNIHTYPTKFIEGDFSIPLVYDGDYTNFHITPTTHEMAVATGMTEGVCPTAKEFQKVFGNGVPTEVAVGGKKKSVNIGGNFFFEPWRYKNLPLLEDTISADTMNQLKMRFKTFASMCNEVIDELTH